MRLGVKDIYYREDGASEALKKKDKKMALEGEKLSSKGDSHFQ